jgi:hypothetical protein
MDQLIIKSNNLLKNILTPSNVLSLAIRFPYNVSSVTQNVTVSRQYQLFKLVNLGLIGSSSWYNISTSIGNNKFTFGQVAQDYFTNLEFRRAYNIRNIVPSTQTPTYLSEFSTYNYTVWPSNTRPYRQGQIDNTGTFVTSVDNTVYTSSPSYISVYGPIIITPAAGYIIKISIFDVFSGTQPIAFNAALSETVYSNAPRTLNTIVPTYFNATNIKYSAFAINIKRADGGPVSEFLLIANNLCTIDSGNDLNRSVISELKTIIGSYNTTTGQAITMSYANTFDYTVSASFFSPITGLFLGNYVIPVNNTANVVTFTINAPLEGSQFYFTLGTVSGRAFNPGDLTNMNYIFKSLALGLTITPDLTIQDGFYSGIYNSPALTNPVSFGWKFITDKITAANPSLIFTINNNFTVNIQNTSVDNIVLGFSNFPSTRSSGRILGFYNVGNVNLPPSSTTVSPNQIDLDSDGQFDKISINFPYLNSIGFTQESNSVIYLQKGSSYLQNISSFLPFYEKVINTNRIDALTFNIVDGKSQPITLFDSLLFTAEIQVFANPDF